MIRADGEPSQAKLSSETVFQVQMPGIGCATDDEHRQKHAKAGRRGERYAQNNG
jgi:hypothetical protein